MIVMINGKWLRVPTKILTDERCSRSDIIVFAYVADKAGESGAQISRAAVAAACELSESTAKRSLHKLVQLNYLSAEERCGAASFYKQLLLEPKRRSSQRRSERRSEPNEKYSENYVERYKDELQAIVNKLPDIEKEVG